MSEKIPGAYDATAFIRLQKIRSHCRRAKCSSWARGQSGCQLAEDLHLAGRKVHLCVGGAPRTARRYRGKDVVEWLHDMGYYKHAGA